MRQIAPQHLAIAMRRAIDAAVTPPDFLPVDAWYCLCVLAGSERQVAERLKRQRIETYLPLAKIEKIVRSHGCKRSIHVRAPAFSGYLFVGMPTAADWREIKETKGVLSFVASENDDGDFVPVRMRQAAIDDLRAMEKRGELNCDYTPPKGPKFAIVERDRVRMKDGVLARYTGVVRRTPSARTVEIIPDLFPGSIVLIDIAKLEVIVDESAVSKQKNTGRAA